MELSNDGNNNDGADDELSLDNGSSVDSVQKQRMAALEEDNRRLRERLAARNEDDEPPSNHGNSSTSISKQQEIQGHANTDTDDTVVPDDSQFAAGGTRMEATAASRSIDMVVDDDDPLVSQLTAEEKKKESHLNAIQRAFEEAFPVNNNVYYDSGKDLAAQMNDLAKPFGFVVSFHGSVASCNRASTRPSDKKHSEKLKEARGGTKRNRVSIKCGCQFECKVSPVKNNQLYREKFPDAPKGAVRITRVNYVHSNGCFPCADQFAVQKKISGKDANNKKQRNTTMTKDIGSACSDHQGKIGGAKCDDILEQEMEHEEKRMAMEECKREAEEKRNLTNALLRAQIETEKARTKQIQSQTRLSCIEERKKLIQARTELLNEGASKEDIDTLLPLTFSSSGHSD